MLTEFAFTPAIFDENAHEDNAAWILQLIKLGSNMFPETAAWPVIVADLYDGSWNHEAERIVKGIKGQTARILCQQIFMNMKKRLVTRSACGNWPDEDIAWGREAVASHAVDPIDRIVATAKTKQSLIEEFRLIRSLDEVQDAGFWSGIRTDESPRMVIEEQVGLLRKLCLHSQWVALINPYGFDGEQDFTLRLLDIALGRNARFGSLDFELHGEAKIDRDPAEEAMRQQHLINHMARIIQPKLSGSSSVSFYFWPKLLDRILVAGNYVKQSNGDQRKRPRWGVSMSHLARGTDPDAAPTEWKLLRRERLDAWFRQFAAEDAGNKPIPTTISPRSTSGG